MLVNIKDAIFNGYVVQSSASALSASSFFQEGGHSKDEMVSHQCLGDSFGHTVSGGA